MVSKNLPRPQRLRLLRDVTAYLVLAAGAALAQTAPPASQGSTPVPSMPAPAEAQLQAAAAKPAADGTAAQPDGKKAKHKKVKAKKEKKPKRTPVSITDGILTVDGFAGKAAMNYQIEDLQYLYIWAPGIGTAVISDHTFPLAKEQPAAFDGPSLTVTVDGHQLQLTSSNRLLGKKPASAWVLLDANYQYPSKYPAVGYGGTTAAPFVWPGSRQSAEAKDKSVVAPPLPKSLLPVQLPVACPATGAQPAGCIPVKPAAAPSSTTTPAVTPTTKPQ